MYQQIILIGNLGNDPELRYTASNVPVASFSLAVNRSWTGQDGERKDKVTWFRVSTWNKQAETVNEYLRKGSKVMVIGEVEEARVFTDRDGNPRGSLEVKAQNVRFMDSKSEGGEGQPRKGNAAPASQSEVDDEAIPF
jgi:single-strand DNA-binding protein